MYGYCYSLNGTDFCSCSVRLQGESSGAAHLKPSLKSKVHFLSSKYFEQTSSDLASMSPDLNLQIEIVTSGLFYHQYCSFCP
ncbi:hypothetical protein Hanom_Chr05g00401241 [Helianthus anomalus]